MFIDIYIYVHTCVYICSHIYIVMHVFIKIYVYIYIFIDRCARTSALCAIRGFLEAIIVIVKASCSKGRQKIWWPRRSAAPPPKPGHPPPSVETAALTQNESPRNLACHEYVCIDVYNICT